MEWVAENASNPGFWVLAAIIVWPLSLLIGAWITRSRYRRINEIAHEVLNDPDANDSDRAWLESELADATDWRTAPALSILAPAFPFMSVFASFDFHRTKENPDDTALNARIEQLQLNIAELRGYPTPAKGKYWRHPFVGEMNDLTVTISFLRNPLLLVWISGWALVSLPILLIGGVVPLSRHVFREMIEPLATRVLTALRVLRIA